MRILIPLLLLTLGVKGNGIIDDLLTSREWTSTDGKPLKAELISADDKIIELRRSSDRRVFKIPFSKISENDQVLVATAKQTLLNGSKSLDRGYANTIKLDARRNSETETVIELKKLQKIITTPESWELARRLGILEQVNENLIGGDAISRNISLPIDSIVLSSGVGKLGETGSTKSFLFKSGDIFIRIKGKNYRQKGQEIVKMWDKEVVSSIAKVGSPLTFPFPDSTKGFSHFSIERIGTSEAVIVNVSRR